MLRFEVKVVNEETGKEIYRAYTLTEGRYIPTYVSITTARSCVTVVVEPNMLNDTVPEATVTLSDEESERVVCVTDEKGNTWTSIPVEAEFESDVVQLPDGHRDVDDRD